jgi:predicted Rossmann-fold nucleotide-binding protein
MGDLRVLRRTTEVIEVGREVGDAGVDRWGEGEGGAMDAAARLAGDEDRASRGVCAAW